MDGQEIGPYRLLSRLGAGGMGEVFLAEDPRLGRRVAIKRAYDSPSTPDARERLRREAFAAAQLNHPNVASVYDVLDVDDLPYIVMEYVEGETLGALIKRGPLPAEQALSIARQIADALSEAHAHAVIHRDLKPANVMVTTGRRVKVLDFGIAREQSQAAAEGGAKPTQVYGTPEYMAPEQFMGSRGDARSDIYSFGALLFELLTGQPPFNRTDHVSRLLAGTPHSAPDPQALNPAIPRALADVVKRALAFRPDQRFQSIDLMTSALEGAADAISEAPTSAVGMPIPSPGLPHVRRWLIAGAIAVLALLLAVWRPWRTPAHPSPTTPIIVAVLPFDVPQGEKDLEALGTGLAEMIVNGLAASDRLTAVPRSTALAYDKTTAKRPDAGRIARDLGANHLIDGALRRTLAGVDLTIRIGRFEPDGTWQRSYSSTLDDVLSMGRRILDDVVVQLGAEGAPSQEPPTSVEAFQQYSQARGLIDRRDIPGNVDRAIELLEAAIGREPQFALAHALLGEACWEKYRQTRERSWVDRGEQEMLLALSLDANQPLIRYSLATILNGTGHSERAEQELRTITARYRVDSAHRLLGIILTERGQFADAMQEFQRAIDVRPGYWANYSAMGVAAVRAGRYSDAERSFLRVTELQPDNADAYASLGAVYLLTDQRERAIEYFRRSIRSSPTVGAWSNLGSTLTEAGRHEEALDAFRQAAALRPRDPLLQRNLGDGLQHLGRTREARAAYTEGARLATEALAVNPKSAESHGALAICLAKLGEFDKALKQVELAAALAPNAPGPFHRRAAVLALAGRRDEAIAALRAGLTHGLAPTVVARDEDFTTLRGSKEFQELVKPKP
jgi:tetratricopeptide (TPR) repeat protein/TolB-like protein